MTAKKTPATHEGGCLRMWEIGHPRGGTPDNVVRGTSTPEEQEKTPSQAQDMAAHLDAGKEIREGLEAEKREAAWQRTMNDDKQALAKANVEIERLASMLRMRTKAVRHLCEIVRELNEPEAEDFDDEDVF